MEQQNTAGLPEFPAQVPVVKRGRGRPRKPENELSAKTLANRQTEANRLARIEHRRVTDEHLKAEIESLRIELNNYPMKGGGGNSERHHVETFIDQGYGLLRDIAYDLKSIQLMEIEQIEEIRDAESSLPPDQWIHMPGFVDATANEIVWHCHQAHLTPALVRFEIKILEAVLQWATENPENFEHRSALEAELDQRKRGEDTFKPRGA
jgi:hypothetical protein